MDWEAIGAIGEMIGALAVVFTLFYLASQIRQNTNALNAESRLAAVEGGHRELFKMVDSPRLVANMVKKEPITEDEQIGLCAFLFAMLRNREFAWGQYQQGAIDKAQWDTEVNVILYTFDTQRNRQWWEHLGRNTFSDDFSNFVDDLLKTHPATETLWQGYLDWAAIPD